MLSHHNFLLVHSFISWLRLQLLLPASTGCPLPRCSQPYLLLALCPPIRAVPRICPISPESANTILMSLLRIQHCFPTQTNPQPDTGLRHLQCRPTGLVGLLLLPTLFILTPHAGLLAALNTTGMFPPQGICTCCSLRRKAFPSNLCMPLSFPQVLALKPPSQ